MHFLINPEESSLAGCTTIDMHIGVACAHILDPSADLLNIKSLKKVYNSCKDPRSQASKVKTVSNTILPANTFDTQPDTDSYLSINPIQDYLPS